MVIRTALLFALSTLTYGQLSYAAQPFFGCRGPSLDAHYDSFIHFYGSSPQDVTYIDYFEYDAWSYSRIPKGQLRGCVYGEENPKVTCRTEGESYLNYRVTLNHDEGNGSWVDIYFDVVGKEPADEPALTLRRCGDIN